MDGRLADRESGRRASHERVVRGRQRPRSAHTAPGYVPAAGECGPIPHPADPVIPLLDAVSVYRKSAARNVADGAGSGCPYVVDAGFASTCRSACEIERSLPVPLTNT